MCKKSQILTYAALVTIYFHFTQAFADYNTIPNGNFESTVGGWLARDSGGAARTISLSTTFAADGQSSAKVAGDVAKTIYIVSGDIAVNYKKQYCFSARLLQEYSFGNTGKAWVTVAILDKNKNVVRSEDLLPSQVQKYWECLNTTILPLDISAYIRITVQVKNFKGNIYLDNVCLLDDVNLIQNPGFENVDGWSCYGTDGNREFRGSDQKHAGVYSGKVQTVPEDKVLLRSKAVPINEFKTFYFSLYLKVKIESGTPMVAVHEIDTQGRTVGFYYFKTITASHGWKHFEWNHTIINAATTQIELLVRMFDTTSIIWIDDVLCRPIDNPLVNSGFERSIGTTDWQVWKNGSNVGCDRINRLSTEGAWSGRLYGTYPITATNLTQDVVYLSSIFQVRPNEVYLVSFDVRTQFLTGGTLTAYIGQFDVNGRLIAVQPINQQVSKIETMTKVSGATRIPLYFFTCKDARYAKVFFGAYDIKGELTVDNVICNWLSQPEEIAVDGSAHSVVFEGEPAKQGMRILCVDYNATAGLWHIDTIAGTFEIDGAHDSITVHQIAGGGIQAYQPGSLQRRALAKVQFSTGTLANLKLIRRDQNIAVFTSVNPQKITELSIGGDSLLLLNSSCTARLTISGLGEMVPQTFPSAGTAPGNQFKHDFDGVWNGGLYLADEIGGVGVYPSCEIGSGYERDDFLVSKTNMQTPYWRADYCMPAQKLLGISMFPPKNYDEMFNYNNRTGVILCESNNNFEFLTNYANSFMIGNCWRSDPRFAYGEQISGPFIAENPALLSTIVSELHERGCKAILYIGSYYYHQARNSSLNNNYSYTFYEKETVDLLYAELKNLIQQYSLDGFYLDNMPKFNDWTMAYELLRKLRSLKPGIQLNMHLTDNCFGGRYDNGVLFNMPILDAQVDFLHRGEAVQFTMFDNAIPQAFHPYWDALKSRGRGNTPIIPVASYYDADCDGVFGEQDHDKINNVIPLVEVAEKMFDLGGAVLCSLKKISQNIWNYCVYKFLPALETSYSDGNFGEITAEKKIVSFQGQYGAEMPELSESLSISSTGKNKKWVAGILYENNEDAGWLGISKICGMTPDKITLMVLDTYSPPVGGKRRAYLQLCSYLSEIPDSIVEINLDIFSASQAVRYDLDEGNGMIAIDTSGNNCDGLLKNSSDAAWVSGCIGNALQFAGVDDYIDARQIKFDTSRFTFTAWIKDGAATALYGVIFSSVENSWDNEIIRLGVRGATAITAINDFDLNVSFNPPTFSGWHQVSLVFCYPEKASLFWDGVKVAEDTTVKSITALPLISSVGAGLSGNYPYKGIMDEVKIYNCALNDEAVRDLFISRGRWHFDEGKGMIAGDSSGYDLNGILVNMDPGSCWTDGKIGKALEFDGVDDYLEVSQVKYDTKHFSVSVWVKDAASAGLYGTLFSTVESSWDNEVVRLGLYNSNAIRALNDYDLDLFYIPVTLLGWHHVVFTYDYPAKASLFWDGVPVAEDEDFEDIFACPERSRMGGHAAGGYPLRGDLDEARIFNYALTAADVKKLFLVNAVP